MLDLVASVEASERQDAEGCVKIAEDLARYREVIGRVKPALIIETGTFDGMSALWFSRAAGCRVVTVDVNDQVPPETKEEWGGDVVQIIGSSVDPVVVAAVAGFVENCSGPVMVVLDSDHSASHVFKELKAYSPFVTEGSYIVVEDGILRHLGVEHRGVYDGDPLGALFEWFSRPYSNGFETDEGVESMSSVSMHPSGWIRKVG